MMQNWTRKILILLAESFPIVVSDLPQPFWFAGKSFLSARIGHPIQLQLVKRFFCTQFQLLKLRRMFSVAESRYIDLKNIKNVQWVA